MRAGNLAPRFLQHSHDVLALGIIQILIGEFGLCGYGKRSQLRYRNAQNSTFAQNDRSLHQVFQFANVPGPVPLQKRVHRPRRDRFDVAIHSQRDLVHEIAHQQRDVLFSLAQRRHQNWEYA